MSIANHTQPNPTRRTNRLLSVSLVASMLVAGSAALAAPYESQSPQMRPQTPSAYEPQDARTQRDMQMQRMPAVDSSRVYDRDRETATVAPHERRQAQPRTIVNPQGIRYMSGGIGADEQAQLSAAQAEYPVKLVFANTHGAYLSDVEVTISDKSGETVLGLQTDGPILLLDLKPGSYTVKANENGQVKTRNITVSSTPTPRSYTMHFEATGPQDYSMRTVE